MKKDALYQFVCFETSIATEDFSQLWKFYESKLNLDNEEVNLLEQSAAKCRFRYVSRHITDRDDFRFVFQKNKHPLLQGDNNVKVVQAGGYMPVQIDYNAELQDSLVQIMVFLNRETKEILAYKELTPHFYLNIYEAYYESCLFPYILEFFVEQAEVDNFIAQLKAQPLNHEIGIYKECVMDAV